MNNIKSRNKKICLLIKSGETLSKVGRKFNISKERVRQICVKNKIFYRKGREYKRIKKKCLYCDNKFQVVNSQLKRKYCSKKCSGLASRKYNYSSIKERNRIYAKNRDKEQSKKFRKKYYEKNKEKILAWNKDYQKRNKDKINKRKRELYKKNRKKYIEIAKKWRRKNPEKARAISKKYYWKYVQRCRKYAREYQRRKECR